MTTISELPLVICCNQNIAVWLDFQHLLIWVVNNVVYIVKDWRLKCELDIAIIITCLLGATNLPGEKKQVGLHRSKRRPLPDLHLSSSIIVIENNLLYWHKSKEKSLLNMLLAMPDM